MLQSKICQKKIKLPTMVRNSHLKTKIKKNKNSIMLSSPLCYSDLHFTQYYCKFHTFVDFQINKNVKFS